MELKPKHVCKSVECFSLQYPSNLSELLLAICLFRKCVPLGRVAIYNQYYLNIFQPSPSLPELWMQPQPNKTQRKGWSRRILLSSPGFSHFVEDPCITAIHSVALKSTIGLGLSSLCKPMPGKNNSSQTKRRVSWVLAMWLYAYLKGSSAYIYI